MGEKVQEEVVKRLKDWIYTLKQSQHEFGIKVVEKLKEEVDSRIYCRFLPDFPEEEKEEDPEEPDYMDL